LSTLTMKDGRVLAGMIRARTGRTLRLQTMTELLVLSADDILKEETTAVSLMPPGLIEAVPDREVRDLMSYLMAKE